MAGRDGFRDRLAFRWLLQTSLLFKFRGTFGGLRRRRSDLVLGGRFVVLSLVALASERGEFHLAALARSLLPH